MSDSRRLSLGESGGSLRGVSATEKRGKDTVPGAVFDATAPGFRRLRLPLLAQIRSLQGRNRQQTLGRSPSDLGLVLPAPLADLVNVLD